MNDARNCENCKWARKNAAVDQGGQAIIGQHVFSCHRAPPTAVLAPTGPGVLTLVAMFPPVDASMFCSMHEHPTDGAPSDGGLHSI